jgi:hypothetical protein
MGEAKRRKEAGTYPARRRQSLSPGARQDIAGIVRGRTLVIAGPAGGIGGTCLFRALSGSLVLKTLGIEANLVAGGVLYRAGPDPARDFFIFGTPDGGGAFLPGGGLLGHVWLEAGDDLIDFSAGDWRRTVDSTPGLSGADLPPIGWTHPPPEFFWAPRAKFAPGELPPPPPGRAWYVGWSGDAVTAVAAVRRAQHSMLADAALQPFFKQFAREALALRRAMEKGERA